MVSLVLLDLLGLRRVLASLPLPGFGSAVGRFGKATVGDVDEPLGGRHIMPVPISVSGPGKTSPGRSVGAGAN